MRDLKYTEILRRNRELTPTPETKPYEAAVLSNTTIGLVKDILEYALRAEGLPAKAVVGEYDNIVQDSARLKNAPLIAIFWELGNIVDGLHRDAKLLDDDALKALEDKTTGELELVVRNLADVPLILVNRFSALPFAGASRLEELSRRLNARLEDLLPKNARLIDTDKLFAEVGLEKSVDFRYYNSSKALYTIEFYKAWAEEALGPVLAATGRAKKALIFDCDNTLWRGVLGEDGAEGLKMSPTTPEGAVFAEIQSIALSLQRRGVLLGLCSKNSSEDVAAVLERHPDMLLRPETIAAKRINWADKAQNLREIASELNIGLDSLVFVDDSPFEAELVRAQLPQVRVLQTPEKLEDYPRLLRKLAGFFASAAPTAEDLRRTELYREQGDRAEKRAAFVSVEEYLASLEQRVAVFENDKSLTARMAQLCQKTNQFNATTKRHTESDISRMLEIPAARLFAFSASDKFGDNGVTGLSIVLPGQTADEAVVDTFLISCRVIGRNIEFAFMDHLVDELRAAGVRHLRARHERTAKNGPAADFFEKCSFRLIRSDAKVREYELALSEYRPSAIAYIEVLKADASARAR